MRSTPQKRELWVKHICYVKRRLLVSGSLTKRQLLELFLIGLDGDFPDEFPELVNAYFQGHSNPMQLATKLFNKWLHAG